MPPMSTLLTGDLIRAARALIGLSQVELAKKAGITQRALGEFELGKRPITARANEKLRRVFDESQIQFIAANIEASHLDGAGVRWKPHQPNSGIKTI
jgi:transcriptional regulator with XRE-family HTH domain